MKKLLLIVSVLFTMILLVGCTNTKYTVSYDLNGGTGNISSEKVKDGGLATIPKNEPLKEGEVFAYWELDGEKFEFTTKITKDITLKATWRGINDLKVTFYPNNEEDAFVLFVKQDELIPEPEGITNDKSFLEGWYLNSELTGERWNFSEDKVTVETTLYAKWLKERTVTAEYSGETRNMVKDENNARLLNLEPNWFNVETLKGAASNDVGLNKLGDIRIYAARTSPDKPRLKISMHTSFLITSVEIKFLASAPETKFVAGTFEQTLTGHGNSEKLFTGLSTNEFSIINNHSGSTADQLHMKYIRITFEQIGPDVPIEVIPNAPEIDVSEHYLTELVVGQEFIAPKFKGHDIEDGEVEAVLDEDTLPNVDKAGIYYVFYYATDSHGHIGKAFITVKVQNVNDVPNYYQSTDGLSGNPLKQELKSILSYNTLLDYGRARDILEIADRDPDNFDNVLLIYNRQSVSGPWDHPTWEREHVWPQSLLGLSKPELGSDAPSKRTDLHNLRAIRPNVNQSRSDNYFVNGKTVDSPNGLINGGYYPGKDDRGDVARILFYMNTLWDLSIREDINMLLEWHAADPVDSYEIIRNEIIYDYQGNRNPYIDRPEFAVSIYATVVTSSNETISFTINVYVVDLNVFERKSIFVN